MAGVIFRITNQTISNETDKTRTDPGPPAVLFHLPWISAGMNLIAHLLPACGHSTSSPTEETESEFALDPKAPPPPTQLSKNKNTVRPRLQTVEPPLSAVPHPQRYRNPCGSPLLPPESPRHPPSPEPPFCHLRPRLKKLKPEEAPKKVTGKPTWNERGHFLKPPVTSSAMTAPPGDRRASAR